MKAPLLCIQFILSFFFITTNTFASPKLPFKKVIVWGHKLGAHTHAYIHYAFHKTFKHLGYETYWFDNTDRVQNFDFSNCLFVTEGQVDQKMPLRSDCRYILHNCTDKRYKPFIASGDAIFLQVYTHDCLPRRVQKIEPYIYYDVSDRTVYMPWATDLLPHEIDEAKKRVSVKRKSNKVYWVGTLCQGYFGNQDKIDGFEKACNENNMVFQKLPCAPEHMVEVMQSCCLAPALQGKWQCEQGYIPCRIFKNISCGHMGITNSKTVNDLFEEKIVYNENTYQLFYDAKKRVDSMNIQELYDLMDFVKNKHTYVNRIEHLLNFLMLVKA